MPTSTTKDWRETKAESEAPMRPKALVHHPDFDYSRSDLVRSRVHIARRIGLIRLQPCNQRILG